MGVGNRRLRETVLGKGKLWRPHGWGCCVHKRIEKEKNRNSFSCIAVDYELDLL